jgi:hypothetical protein
MKNTNKNALLRLFWDVDDFYQFCHKNNLLYASGAFLDALVVCFLTNSDDFTTVIPDAENIFYPVYPEIRTN